MAYRKCKCGAWKPVQPYSSMCEYAWLCDKCADPSLRRDVRVAIRDSRVEITVVEVECIKFGNKSR